MSESYEVIATYSFLSEAKVALSKLQAAGIEAMIDDNKSISIIPLFSGSVGEIHLFVAGDDAERAVELLTEQTE